MNTDEQVVKKIRNKWAEIARRADASGVDVTVEQAREFIADFRETFALMVKQYEDAVEKYVQVVDEAAVLHEQCAYMKNQLEQLAMRDYLHSRGLISDEERTDLEVNWPNKAPAWLKARIIARDEEDDPNKTALRDYLCLMAERCPWLPAEWPQPEEQK